MEVPGVQMVQHVVLVSVGMAISSHDSAWVGASVVCGCATVYDTPFFNVSVWTGFRVFSKVAE